MTSTCKIVTIVGARPQFIKAAPLSRALAKADGVEELLIHTGQHFDRNMSSVFFEDLGIPEPKYNLDIHGLNHGAMTGRMLEGIESLLVTEKPNAIIVYGDTNSTLAGALSAAKLHIPVVHIEAGLRSFNRRMPEEINRVMVDHLSEFLFCPTQTAVNNLTNEGITSGVHHIGDVMYDATLYAKRFAQEHSTVINDLNLADKEFALLTLHRAENTDNLESLKQIVDFLENEAASVPIVFPIHPRTKSVLDQNNIEMRGVMQVDPVGYFDMQRLLNGARAVYTDSGGLQKEAYFHRTPCITLRDETEWVETIDAGWNRLWTNLEEKARQEITEYGDGRSCERLVEILIPKIR